MDEVQPKHALAIDRRRVISGGLLVCAPFAGSSSAQDRAAEFGTSGLDRGRVTVPVQINDGRALKFAVDSAANCSVIASDLIAPLGLPLGETLTMHTLVGREETPSVRADRLHSDALTAKDVRLAVGNRLAMDGLDGLLGADLLTNHRLLLNFKGQARTRISRSRSAARGFFDPVNPSARLNATPLPRFGDLLSIPIRIGSAPGIGIIDSGAGVSVLNRAAAAAGRATPAALDGGATGSRVQSPTGRTAPVDVMLLPALGFAGVTISRVPVLVGDLHTFDIWGAADRPAMLMGVDILGLFDSVMIDLKRGEFTLKV